MWPFKRRSSLDPNAMALAARDEQIRKLAQRVEELEGPVKKSLDDYARIMVGPQQGAQKQKANWPTNRHDLVDSVKGSSYIAIGATARKVAMQEAEVFVRTVDKSGEKLEPVSPDHLLPELFREVNPLHTQFDLWWYTVGFKMSTGDAYWWKSRNALNVPVELWPIPSTWVWAVPSPTKVIEGYQVKGVFSREEFVPAEDMVHLQEPNLDWRGTGRFYGYSPEQAGASMVVAEEQLFRRVLADLRNFAPPGMLFETDKALTLEQMQDIYSWIIAQHALSEHSGRPMVIPMGLKGKMPEGQREMNWFESLDFSMNWLLALYGTPKAAVGLVQDVNRANYFAAILSWIENVINPMLVHMGQHLTQGLARDFDERLVVKFPPCKVNDAEQIRKDIETLLKHNAADQNEVREILMDLGPFQTGGNRPMINQSLVPAPYGNEDIPEDSGRDTGDRGKEPPTPSETVSEDDDTEKRHRKNGKGSVHDVLFKSARQELHDAVKDYVTERSRPDVKPTVVNVNMPPNPDINLTPRFKVDSPGVNVEQPEVKVVNRIMVPREKQDAPSIVVNPPDVHIDNIVNVPENLPVVENTVNVPEPPEVVVNVPELAMPDVVVNVPEQPAPDVNVNVEVPRERRHVEFERDRSGKIKGAVIDDG